ncbi:hypothetical protein HDU97_004760 [Phlyctochytrium planicorne]|nr:hypothetical protein HDU97_004760 [Phlyctochytrium planicorne]
MQPHLIVAAAAAILLADAASAQNVCGSVPYDPAQYTCTDNSMLCPGGTVACGSPSGFACYDTTQYCCVNKSLQQKGSAACAVAPPAPSTTSTTTKVVVPTSTTTKVVVPTSKPPTPSSTSPSTGGGSSPTSTPVGPATAKVGTSKSARCIPSNPGTERNFCVKFDDDFDFLNFDNWKHDITLRGGGNWEFQNYVNNRTNSYVQDGVLYIKPTLTSNAIGEAAVMSGGTINLWGNSEDLNSCTDNGDYGCQRSSDGNNIINPIQSALLRSVRSYSFRYGKVEVRAQLPKGDWIWPAIWMLPKNGVYGQWPSSGEIDIMESRGNSPSYGPGGWDKIGSTLHWGPNYFYNRYPLTHADKQLPDDGFHTYGLIWTPETITTYVDDPSNVVLSVPMQDFWAKGGFPSNMNSPWAHGCENQAPFDQEFYLILNVAVGGTGGYFPSGTPWSLTSNTALRDFWNARGQWLPSWKGDDVAMKIDKVTVWELC